MLQTTDTGLCKPIQFKANSEPSSNVQVLQWVPFMSKKKWILRGSCGKVLKIEKCTKNW